jgi:very-short-patch-repair endonuclease
MTRFYNCGRDKAKRRALRKEMPRAEVVLWSRLRGKQVWDAKFRRQFGVGPYLIDFYCPSMKLAIEVDGDSHFGDGAEERDEKRQRYLESFGIEFLRLPNELVLNETETVIQMIAWKIEDMRAGRSAQDHPQTDPPQSPLIKGGRKTPLDPRQQGEERVPLDVPPSKGDHNSSPPY